MKPKISPDIDRLMWLVAEGGDTKAIDEFAKRFPNLRGEMGKRLEMVRSIRGMNDEGEHRIPEFKLRAETLPPTSPKLLAVAVGIVAVAIALGAYSVMSNNRVSEKLPPVIPISTQMPTIPPVKYSNNLPEPSPSVAPQVTPPPTQEPVQTLPDYMREQDFAFNKTKLSIAIRMIANAGHFSVTIAPGLADIDITADYPQMTAVEALKHLGTDYGFTPFEEEIGNVTIIPARDNVAPRAPTPDPYGEIDPHMKATPRQ